jgi:hypothetical protein
LTGQGKTIYNNVNMWYWYCELKEKGKQEEEGGL